MGLSGGIECGEERNGDFSRITAIAGLTYHAFVLSWESTICRLWYWRMGGHAISGIPDMSGDALGKGFAQKGRRKPFLKDWYHWCKGYRIE